MVIIWGGTYRKSLSFLELKSFILVNVVKILEENQDLITKLVTHLSVTFKHGVFPLRCYEISIGKRPPMRPKIS